MNDFDKTLRSYVMKGIGQIQDVIVRPLPFSKREKFKYGLVAGSRRYHAIMSIKIIRFMFKREGKNEWRYFTYAARILQSVCYQGEC